jgi:phenylacetyl-CoA:acceptor oxidoreductase 26-kDa subunit
VQHGGFTVSFGPNPWQQTSWDARAAGNFIGGGAGCGLLIFTWLASPQGSLRSVLIVLALALVSLGLLCVWAEIGRPWRSINVIINPRTSWMSREAALAPLLLGSGALALFGVAAALPLAALLALGFVYCQARILQAAKGIPAWREPLSVPLLVATGLAEGAGLYWLFAPWWGQGGQVLWLGFGALLALRFVIGMLWHRRLSSALRPRALQAVDQAGHAFNAGSLLPLAIVVLVLAAPLPPGWSAPLQALAGALAALGGAGFKFMLVTRAGFNQGFALPHLPVRGVRR